MASRKEVADLAGVSEATVSRVLNGVGPLKEETRRKVLEASEQLGYVPSALARSFARSKSGNLGVVLPYVPKAHLFSAYFFSEMLSGIGSKARDSGMDLLVMFRTPGEVMNYTDLFRRQKVDACIILGARDDHGEMAALQQLQQAGHPFCIMNQHFAGESFMEVDADHVEGSRLAIRHLTDQGYRNIVFLNGPDSYSNSQERLQGVRIGLNEAGMNVDSSLLLEGNYSRRSGVEAAAAIVSRLDEIDAVFAANDRMAIGVMHGLRERGIKVQDFPAFVGYDDSDAAEMAVPPLSSVRVPFYEMGELAASKLIQGSLGGTTSARESGFTSESARELLPTELVIRASSIRK
ncbi:LacI family DNA-binding transcriptional regulator [Paenibacillus sp. NPDC056933]|uniref:LacI family DNA-binding transcriptional regulator n=1 Tax=Paenibacillus sp. NPDC056933 TaxID=3345968 RepID=UPI003628F5B6